MSNYPFEKVKSDYTHRWAAMEIHSNRLAAIIAIADKIIKNKNSYIILQKQTGVPWYFIGLLHFRESSCSFNRHLHNGDPLINRTYRIPPGRPLGQPPFTFEESAIDALNMMGYTKIKTWTIEQIAYRCEMFNGFGYRDYGVPSAYLWSGTNQYEIGKFIKDHVFDANVVDVQQGCMAVFKIILDKTNEQVTIENEEEIAVDAPKAQINAPTNKQMNEVSRKHWWNDWLKWFGAGTAGSSGVYKTVSTLDLEYTKSTLATVKQIAEIVGVFGIIAVGIGIVIYTMHQSSLMKQDIVEGRATPSGESDQ